MSLTWSQTPKPAFLLIYLRKSEDIIGRPRWIGEMIKIGGVSETGHFSLFFFEKNPKNVFFEKFSKYVDVSCTNEQDILGNIESKRLRDDFIALNEKT